MTPWTLIHHLRSSIRRSIDKFKILLQFLASKLIDLLITVGCMTSVVVVKGLGELADQRTGGNNT